MTRVFEGAVWVSYGQAYLFDAETELGDLGDCFAGQRNGLCGAAHPGMLFLISGLHTGEVPFNVDVLDTAPPLDDPDDPADPQSGWEDVVEVSFSVTATRTDPDGGWRSASDGADGVEGAGGVEVVLEGWGGGGTTVIPLPTAGDYRVRYSTSSMDAGHAQDTRGRNETILERHLLQLWPAPPAPDAVLRQTSENAAYWHTHARSLPAPEQRAETTRLAEQQAQQDQKARAEAHEITMFWGGRAPSARLREVGYVAATMARVARDLLDHVADLHPAAQRAAARWLARRAFEHAGLDTVDWARAGLDALEHDQPLPPPFAAALAGDLTEAFTLTADLDPWPGWTTDTPPTTPDPASPRETSNIEVGIVEPPPSTSGVGSALPPHSRPRSSRGELGSLADGLEPGPRPRGVHRPTMAVPALTAAHAPDPLHALVEAFQHAHTTFADQPAALITELRAHLAASEET